MSKAIEDGLGVDPSLVGESAETSDIVVEGNVNFDGLRHEILDVLQPLQLALAHNVLPICDNHTCHKSTERSDTISLTNA